MVSREFTRDVVVGMVGLILLTGCAGQAQTEVQGQFTEHQGQILFDGGESPDQRQIYFMDPDGSHLQPLTEKPSGTASDNAAFGAWSPDRQKVAFNTTRDGNVEIYVMDADGSNVQRLTHSDKADARPAWSPDGQRVVFHSDHEIFVMDADGGNVEQLTSGNRWSSHPDW